MNDIARAAIIAAADELFNTRGYKNVTTSDIARKLGISKKTLYQSFSGKEELATAVIESVLDRISAEFNGLGDHDDPIAALRTTLLHAKREVTQLHPLFLEDIQTQLPRLWQTIQERRAGNLLKIEDAIRKAQQMGMAGPMDAHLATILFLESVQAILRPAFFSRHKISTEVGTDALIHLFIHGIVHDAH